MKNLTKIFTAVVAGMLAFSCVTDTTEDLGIQIVGGGKTTNEVTLSMEAARTHLGEKADGVYPLYWSEGDAISVNGVASSPLEGVGESKTAVFKFAEGVTTPLCVVYPAAAVAAAEEVVEGEEEAPAPVTVYPVNFLATQPYTVGTFAPQAAPMYGYAATPAEGEELEAVQMQHLTGVLRLAISGNGEKVTGIAVRAQNGKIAGAFTVDCTNGTLTPVEASNTVNVTFDGGLVLGAEATPIYLTIPAGKYGTFVITVTTEAHESMTLKFNSDVKPINAGTVREFTAFAYEANTNDAEDIFIIDSEDKLVEFAKIASVFYPRTKAQVTATLDMSGYDWKPIENFGAYEFDGGSEEGCEIQGLKAPLFGTTNAAISNVKLTDVNYTVTDLAHSGAIACKLNDGSLNNCSAAGTININNTTLAEAGDKYKGICHGGLVGFASAATFTNCTNDIDITVTSVSAEALSRESCIGGILACVSGGCSFDQCTNNGDITYVGTTKKGNMYLSGVVGKNDGTTDEKDFVAISNCTNNGAISSAVGSITANDLCLAGITGRLETATADVVCSNLQNNGAITHNGKCAGVRLGGLVSYVSVASFNNCKNTGDVTIGTNGVNTSCYMSGMFGGTITTETIEGLTNEGAVTIQDPATEDLKKAHGYVQVSGVALGVTGGTNDSDIPTINNVTNKGAISVGRITNTSTGNGGRLYVAGLFNNIYAGRYTNCNNEATGTVTAKTGKWSTQYMVGGLITYISSKSGISTLYLTDCENKAAVLLDPFINETNTSHSAEVGGFAGEAYVDSDADTYHVEFLRVKNSGSVTVKGTYSTSGYPYCGGMIGVANYDSLFFTDCHNSGEVNYEATSVNPCVGGIIAYDTTNWELKLENCTNSGNVNYNTIAPAGAKDNTAVRSGGFIGYRGVGVTTLIKGCTNTGKITLMDGQTATASAFVPYALGGIIGWNNGGKLTLENCTNGELNDTTGKGKVYMGTLTAAAGISLGGMVGLTTATATFTGCKNYGTIEQIGGSGSSSGSYRAHLAGILGCSLHGKTCTITITNCENYGAVTYGKTTQTGRVDMGGIMGTSQTAATTTLTGCKNGGVITFSPTGGGSEISVGGIFGTLNKGTLTNCTNLASGHIISKGNSSSNFELGGIAGSTAGGAANLYNCDNYAHVDQQVYSKGTTQIGGVCGYAYTFGTIDGCDNYGKVSFKGADAADQVSVGGVVAYSRIRRADATTAEDGTVTPAGVSTISNCSNYADQDWTGSRGKSNFQGGVVGYCRSVETGEAVYTNWKNVADIKVGGTATTPYFGGLAGFFGNTSILEGGVCYGNVYAIGKEGVANYVGFCVGAPRTETRILKNIQIGGNMVYAETTETVTEEDANGGDPITTVVTTPTLTPLTAENLGQYVYNAAVETSVITGDGCSYIATKPTVPGVPAE